MTISRFRAFSRRMQSRVSVTDLAPAGAFDRYRPRSFPISTTEPLDSAVSLRPGDFDDQHAYPQIPSLSDHRSARPALAGAGHRPRAAVVQRRPARWQPGVGGADGTGPQTPDVRIVGEARLQGDRSRLSRGIGDR